jgi:hypothetical protein
MTPSGRFPPLSASAFPSALGLKGSEVLHGTFIYDCRPLILLGLRDSR